MANKPFDLKAALRGQPIYWAPSGNTYRFKEFRYTPVPRLRCFNVANDGGTYIDVNLDGTLDYEKSVVTMVPCKVKKTVYVNFYSDTSADAYWRNTAEDAKRTARPDAIAVAVPVEIEVDEDVYLGLR